MANGIMGWFGGFIGMPGLTVELILGYLFSPLASLLECHGLKHSVPVLSWVRK